VAGHHFYRLVTGAPGGGDKPRRYANRNTDVAGNITSSRTKVSANNICRGPYTDFCGYFYQNNSTAFVA
jgi:hypothetical protein